MFTLLETFGGVERHQSSIAGDIILMGVASYIKSTIELMARCRPTDGVHSAVVVTSGRSVFLPCIDTGFIEHRS